MAPSDVATTPDAGLSADAAAGDPDVSAPDAGGTSADAGDAGKTGACLTSGDCSQPAKGCLANACISGVCTPQTLADGTPCTDGDPCTASAACKGGVCKAVKSVTCDDGNPCTTSACDGKLGGCAHTLLPEGTACDDGVECTGGTVCQKGGVCGGGSKCPCASTKDCAAFDDGNPCNGTLYCDDTATNPVCVVLPASAVFCDTSADGACTKTACDSATGKCVTKPIAAGSACDDGNPCTVGTACADGSCVAAANTCQCQGAADCLQYEDGNPCNGTLYCDKSKLPYACVLNPASPVVCPPSADPCKVSACDPKTGGCKLGPAADGTPCDDGNSGTVGEVCEAGLCKGGVSITECQSSGDCAKLEDGDFCNGTLFCNLATNTCQQNPATVVHCPTVADTVCSKNKCEPATGLCKFTPSPINTACDDGNACTQGDHCENLKCVPSADVCQCKADADCAAQDDGNLCNGTLFCDKEQGKCVLNPATIVTCPTVDDTTCTKHLCAPKTGKCGPVAAPDATVCDDGDPCSDADACLGGKCVGTKTCMCATDADCAAQDDGDLCNGTLFCDTKTGKCKTNPATVKVCPTVDDTACALNTCEPKTGKCQLVPAFTGAACDADGNPCTTNDYCDQGTCKPGKSTCGCYLDADCAGKQGDNKCVVELYCDKSSYTCKPAKSVACDQSKDTPCRKTSCDPGTGQCVTSDQPEGTICGESAICAGAQLCKAGACVDGLASDCDDADACTTDACDPKSGCKYAPADSGACDDGSVCTTEDGCSKGQCVGTAKDCSDASPCTDDACDPLKGCVYLPSSATVCDDGDLCQVGDFCLQGLCLSGSKVLLCDDGNPCTDDGCDPKQGCTAVANTGDKCDDGDKCTKSDKCSGGSCKGVGLSCDDGSGCTVDSCDPDEGCVHLAQSGTPCDDGNACTIGDACIASGLCASGTSKVCDDANPCTVDLCDPMQGCVVKAVVGSKCDDGDACTVNEKCASGKCVGSARDCDDGLVCSKDTCDVDAGCQYLVVAGSKCDDGNACTAGDQCMKSGACAPGAGLDCSDGNGCTTDACDAVSGCTHKTLDGIGCDDGDGCTTADKCVSGSCKGVGKSCDDGLACTLDDCDKAGGCVHKAQTDKECSDNNACTLGDACLSSGYCKPGATQDCDDSNACTTDVCMPKAGCVHTTKTGAACDDGNACTQADTCSDKAVCSGGPTDCDDGKSCTADTCDKLAGCKHAAKAGSSCDDGNLCTVNDTCLANGACAPGPGKNCDDNLNCTLDTCNAKSGCDHAALDKASCDDGSACTQGDACQGNKCVGSPVACDDGEPCTKDSCDKAKGCVHTPLPTDTSCSDGNACTEGDKCSPAGTCAPGNGLNCDDGKPCTTDGCVTSSGCIHKALDGVGCSDNDACTGPDVCVQGACKGGTISCDDDQSCTKDSCDIKSGCAHLALTGQGCSDGNACTKNDTCTKLGQCAAGTAVQCNDDNLCTKDTCDPASGCKNLALTGTECSDGDHCTTLDVCNQGTCKGSAVDCDDANPCTKNDCGKQQGCLNTPLTGTTCNDGDACTAGDKCDKVGACVGVKVTCDDKNTCTLDACNAVSGCVYTKLQGAVCDDGKLCTVGDACANGQCVGAEKNCDDGKDCTADSCDVKAGCKHVVQTGKACNDGNECTVSDKCNTSAACTGAKKNCDDANGCTLDSCNSYIGCVYALAKSGDACEDGDACTLNWCDGAGACQSRTRLWAVTFKAGYTPKDMLVDADGSAVVVGESNSASLGAFFQRLANKGPQSEVVPAPNLIRWHGIVARPGGGYIVTGEAVNKSKMGGATSARIGRLDAQGKLLGLTETVSPHAWQKITTTGSRVVVAGPMHIKGPGSDSVAFASSSISSDGFIFNKTWTPPESDSYSEQTVHGIAPLSGTGAYALVTSTSRNGAVTWGVKISSTGVLTATRVWSTPRNADYGFLGKYASIFGVVPQPDGFELHLGTTRRRRYDTSANLVGVHTVSSPLPASNNVVAARGNQIVSIGADAGLRIYNRAQTALHSLYKLDTVPALLRVGPERNLYLLQPPADGVPVPLWAIERRDPWGNNLCSGCLTNHGVKGCAAHDAMSDSCSVATGQCKGSVDPAFCDDGNSCTLDKYLSGKGCTHTAQTNLSCSVNDTYCQVASAGKCTSAGVCNRAPVLRTCANSNTCQPTWCSDYASTSGNACVAMQEPAGTVCGSNKYCSSDYCYTASGVSTYQVAKQPVTLLAKGDSKTLLSFGSPNGRPLWIRIQLDHGKVNYDFDLELHTNNDMRKLLSSAAPCGGDLHSNCISSEIGSVVFPSPNLPHTWVNDKMKTYAFAIGKLAKPWRINVKRTSGCVALGCSDQTDIGLKVWLDYY